MVSNVFAKRCNACIRESVLVDGWRSENAKDVQVRECVWMSKKLTCGHTHLVSPPSWKASILNAKAFNPPSSTIKFCGRKERTGAEYTAPVLTFAATPRKPWGRRTSTSPIWMDSPGDSLEETFIAKGYALDKNAQR